MLFPAFVDSDIVLTSEKGLVGEHLADHAFGLLLSLTRSIAWAARQRRWDNRLPMRRANRELSRMTAGIIGLGGTGVAVARRAQAFGMRSIAVDPDVTERPEFVQALSPPERLLEMAGTSDVLFVCCPLTQATYHLVDDEVLGAMPPGGYLINVTRGPIVDQEALLNALERGTLAGAGLDVTEVEPFPDDSPLWNYDNVVITPHTAGASQFRVGRIQRRVIENIRNLATGNPLEGVIDKHQGY
jgi:D-3-phosphoglycerate dehydrogenase